MTKVIGKIRDRLWLGPLLLIAGMATSGWSQATPPPASGPAIRVLGKSPPLHLDSAESLYLQLRSVGLDPARVYRVRGAAVDRTAFNITLDDGTIAFTADVAGRVTGAFFEGEGQILLSPPNQIERSSMALFTGSAILEERFASAYFRFNDDTFAELQPFLRPGDDDAATFVSQWDGTARTLAQGDALRLLMSFSQFLPVSGQGPENVLASSLSSGDRMLHVRVQGQKLGTFDVYFDSNAPEQAWVGQSKTIEGMTYYDVWTSFSLPRRDTRAKDTTSMTDQGVRSDTIEIGQFKIRAEVKPPTELNADAVLQLVVRQGGERAVLFELSRSLQIKQVEADGHPVEFIHNQAIEGTQLARRGNDLVAVVFAQPLVTGQHLELHFVYGGEVLSEAGAGLLYVGARGTWYPNRGIAMSNFDLEFRYPAGWTLVATGKRVDVTSAGTAGDQTASGDLSAGEQKGHWISERPIPVAGFNLGKYERVVASAGDVKVETYATSGVERGFPEPPAQAILPGPPVPSGTLQQPLIVTSAPPSPARNAQAVATASAHAIEFFSKHFGPFPFSELALTQMPGVVSQGWPGLIFLSSLSFLTTDEKTQLHMGAVQKTIISQVIAHETAHQWWGDVVSWNGYRDQWIIEALANYSSLMLLEQQDAAKFRAVMDQYREDLLEKNQAGTPLMEDGPVTLGTRLSCSQFPNGYEAISYGRGTWLLHMLRYMMRDAEEGSLRGASAAGEEPFVGALRRLRDHYEGKPVTTRELLKVFEEELPPSLRYEGRKSLDWFYQGWVNGTAIPRFELHGVRYSDKPGSTTISGTILQKNAPDNLVTYVPVFASRQGRTLFVGRVFADGPETSFRLTAAAGTRRVVLDPNQTLLRLVH